MYGYGQTGRGLIMAESEEQQYTTPSYNPADTDEAGLNEFLINHIKMQIEKVAPAEIVSYDRNTNRAVVQILNQSIYSNGSKLTKKTISDIPIFMMSGGGFVFSFPVKQGDKGWIIAADRDISVFKQLLSIFAPATYEMHKYKDGFFLPDKIKGFEIAADDDGAVILQSDDGTTKISIKDGQITMTAASVTINGDLTVNGTATATTDVIAAGISGKSHTHGGVQSGGSNTGAPQ